MQTSIGKNLDRSRRVSWMAAGAGAAVVATDLLFSGMGWSYPVRSYPVLGALVVFAILAKGNPRSLGLRIRPQQGFLYWLWATVAIACAVGFLVVVTVWLLSLAGREYSVPSTTPRQFPGLFLHACILAPLVEEGVYRFTLCTPGATLLGTWRTILLSGIVFALLHVVYGNPSPENLVGGFFLAWAYLKSGSILVPIILHALGNLVVLLGQLGVWYIEGW